MKSSSSDPDVTYYPVCENLLSILACPNDGSPLSLEGQWLVSHTGRKYPIVKGVPVLLRDDVAQTIGLMSTSDQMARQWVEGIRPDPWFIETLGCSPKQRELVRSKIASRLEPDTVISHLLAATNGMLYKKHVGSLEHIPIPTIRLPVANGESFLDVGCSWGRWSLAAASRGYRPIGLDPSLGAVLEARRIASSCGLSFRGVVGDARSLPFRDNSIDVGFSYSVLQHFSKSDARKSLKQIADVVRQNGMIRVQMASVFGIRSLQHIVRRGFRDPQNFEVRYWTPKSLSHAALDAFGDCELEVDCYFGLGLQSTDRKLYSPLGRVLVSSSEALRRLSQAFAPLRLLADSLYLVSRNTRSA